MQAESQNEYMKILMPWQLVDNGDFADNTYIDTIQNGVRWDRLRVEFHVGTLDAAIGSTAEGTAPYLEECDTTDGTYTAVTGKDGAAAALADAIGATEDDSIFAIEVDLRDAHKRYMEVNVPHIGDGTTGGNLCIIGRLFGGGVAPTTAALRGLAEHIIV